MTDDVLADARQRAERSSPPVRAAALMRIARVESTIDRQQARQSFERGLEEVRSLSGFEREWLLEQARLLAAAVVPDLLSGIRSSAGPHRHFESERIARIMLDHEFGEAAYDYVTRYDDPSTFPFGCVLSLMQWFGDDERRLTLFRRAVEVWRTAEPDPRFGNGFLSLFQWAWTTLPTEEAREVAHEIVSRTLSRPDSPTQARYEFEDGVTITSIREHTLFQILHVLRQLDAPLAESLIAENPQLAAAARRFPNGIDTIREEAEQRRNAAGATCGGGYGMAGNPRDFPYMRALIQASREGEFGPAIDHALEQYRRDAAPESPNQAPREFWPSTCRFRSILYRIGKQFGRAGTAYLERIPDEDLRLFAEIEFEAALAGLPELQGSQREYRPRPLPPRTPMSDNIRCPKCNWRPAASDRWFCKCGHSWNTFTTAGMCPACQYQWSTTVCLGCLEFSPHSEWYQRD